MDARELSDLVYRRRKAYFENWREHVRRIKEMAESILGPSRVYVFGSIVRGEAHPALSDIDVAIVSDSVPESHLEKARIKAEILDAIGPMNPFELHLLKPKEFEWYRRFMDVCEEV